MRADAEAFALMEALLLINNEVHTPDQVCMFQSTPGPKAIEGSVLPVPLSLPAA